MTMNTWPPRPTQYREQGHALDGNKAIARIRLRLIAEQTGCAVVGGLCASVLMSGICRYLDAGLRIPVSISLVLIIAVAVLMHRLAGRRADREVERIIDERR